MVADFAFDPGGIVVFGGCISGGVFVADGCPGVETAVGDPAEEVERLDAVAKRRNEAEEEADYRAVERGHVSATSGGRVSKVWLHDFVASGIHSRGGRHAAWVKNAHVRTAARKPFFQAIVNDVCFACSCFAASHGRRLSWSKEIGGPPRS